MNYRALIFDDQKDIRQMLWSLFESRGYEVFTFPHPALCPLDEAENCPCPKEQACADIIISDVEMPFKDGLAFIEDQIGKGCRCNHIALMSGALTNAHFARAASLGLKIFKKPFRLEELSSWLDQVEKNIDPQRKLADWFLGSVHRRKD